MADPTKPDPAGASTELVAHDDEIGIDRLQRRPIIDRIDPRQLDLIKRTIAVAEGDQAITNAELGHFLELCALYGLDPFAREAWIAKSKTGKLLIMVGRDGLRKIADRNGLRVQGDVIHAKDDFRSTFIDNPADAKPGEWESHGGSPFHRVEHVKRGVGEARGPVAGAWSRVTARSNGVEAGYFDAPISEYRPSNVSVYSPWSKQESAMMRAAVDRQAIREATPLGGLLAIGEDESANTLTTGGSTGEAPGWHGLDPAQRDRAEAIVARARELGYNGLTEPGTLQMDVNGKAPHLIDAKLAEWEGQLASVADAAVADATEVVDAPATEADPLIGDPGALDARALDLMSRAEAATADGDHDTASAFEAEASALHDEAEALRAGQTTLGGM